METNFNFDAFCWADEMIEGLEEEENCTGPNIYKDGYIHGGNVVGNEITLPQGYQFVDENGNVINARKIVLEKKEKEYPKTYEECCKVLGYSGNYNMILTTDVDNKLFNALYRLKVCRDAYWKIAGEEMGLGKPWEPDWTYNGATKYCIGVSENEIQNFSSSVAQYILAFPTEKMRDAFYENFKELIESVKELL